MKKPIIVIGILFITALLIGYFLSSQKKPTPESPTTESQPNNKITSPVSGETWVKGETYTVSWTGGKKGEALFLIDTALEKDGVSISLADRVYDISDTASYTYTVPENIPDGKYKVQIAGLTSGEFAISSN